MHPHFNDHTSRLISLASTAYQIYAHADIDTRQRAQSVAHKFSRQFFGTGEIEIRISFRDDAENGYNLGGYEFLNFGKELSKLIFVCAKISIAIMQAKL